jgi:GNAT superfamily N-acetyltransferase
MSELTITTDRAALNVALIHRYLSEESYWARGITREQVQRSIDHSLCFGGYVDGAQVAFGRVITDYTTFAWLCDIFVTAGHRGKGYSKALVAAIQAHPDLQGLRRMLLGTLDANSLYAQFGFTPLKRPQRLMEINHMVFSGVADPATGV